MTAAFEHATERIRSSPEEVAAFEVRVRREERRVRLFRRQAEGEYVERQLTDGGLETALDRLWQAAPLIFHTELFHPDVRRQSYDLITGYLIASCDLHTRAIETTWHPSLPEMGDYSSSMIARPDPDRIELLFDGGDAPPLFGPPRLWGMAFAEPHEYTIDLPDEDMPRRAELLLSMENFRSFIVTVRVNDGPRLMLVADTFRDLSADEWHDFVQRIPTDYLRSGTNRIVLIPQDLPQAEIALTGRLGRVELRTWGAYEDR